MVGRLDNFNIILVRRPSRDFQSCSHKRFLEVAIEFIAVPMAFADFSRAVGFVCERSRLEFARPSAQPHRAAHFVHAQQLAQFVNHAVRRLWIKFRAVRLLQTRDVARILDRCALHAQADSKIGHFLLARVLNRVNHSLNPALAESAWYQNSIVVVQSPRRRFRRIHFFRFDPVELGFVIVRQPAMQQRLTQALIRIFELHVFPNYGDPYFARGMMHAVDEVDPRLHVRRP